MRGTFGQICIQLVFDMKGRQNLIGNSWKSELHKYIAKIIKCKSHARSYTCFYWVASGHGYI